MQCVVLVAGDRFELPMLRAYETGVVAALPANLVPSTRIELVINAYQAYVMPFN